MAPMYVTKFEKDVQDQAIEYCFIDAFPQSINSMPVAYGQSEILKVTVSFFYSRYVKRNLIGQRSQSRTGRYSNQTKSSNPADYLRQDNSRIAAELDEQVNRNPFARDTADRFGDFFVNRDLGIGANDNSGALSGFA